MFRPNQNCVITRVSGKNDVYGMPVFGARANERCAIITLKVINAKSAVRADTSASRGNARELESEATLLLTKSTSALIDDMIEIRGTKLRVMSIFPRHDLQGALDHYEVGCSYWSAA